MQNPQHDDREAMGGPDVDGHDPHATDAAELGPRSDAHPTLIDDRANLRADDPDSPEEAVEVAREERAALLDQVEEERRE